MDDLKIRVMGAIHEVLDKYFQAPERNWPEATHQAIANVKQELLSRVESEFGKEADVTAAIPSPAAGKAED